MSTLKGVFGPRRRLGYLAGGLVAAMLTSATSMSRVLPRRAGKRAVTRPVETASPPDGASAVSEEEALEIATDAYISFYPPVTMDVTRRRMTNAESGEKPGFGPMNAFHHMRAHPPADMKVVVRPNFDTLYSIAWLDLTKEPVWRRWTVAGL